MKHQNNTFNGNLQQSQEKLNILHKIKDLLELSAAEFEGSFVAQ